MRWTSARFPKTLTPQKRVSGRLTHTVPKKQKKHQFPSKTKPLMSLASAIFDAFAPKMGKMTMHQIVRFTVKSTLKQVAKGYNMEYSELKKEYLKDGADFYVDEPVGGVTAPTALVPAKAPKAVSTTSTGGTSKMKKEDLVAKCQELGLSTDGTVPELRARIKGAPAPTKVKKPKAPLALEAPEVPEAPVEPESPSPETPAPEKKKKKKKVAPEAPVAPAAPVAPEAPAVHISETLDELGAPELEPEEDDFVEEQLTLRQRLNLLLHQTNQVTEDEEAETEAEEE